MNIRDVRACPKCISEDITLKYQAEPPKPERILVTCNDCGYQFDAECADAKPPRPEKAA